MIINLRLYKLELPKVKAVLVTPKSICDILWIGRSIRGMIKRARKS